MSVVALAASGPASAAARPADEAIASRSAQSVSAAAGAGASDETAAATAEASAETKAEGTRANVSIAESDVASATVADVAATLEHLGDDLKAKKTAASEAQRAADAAAADLDALAGDSGKGAGAGAAVAMRLVTTLNRAATPALEAPDVSAAREKLEDAKSSAADATSALQDAEAAHAAFLASTEERVKADLVDADAAGAKRDADTAEALRADAAELNGNLEAISRHGPGTSAAEARAAAEKAKAERAAAAKAKAEKAAAEAKAKAAAEAERRRRMPLPDPTGSASGSLTAAWCSNGERIVVDSSIGGAVQRLLDVAHHKGVDICARSAFRPYAEQVQLRRQNCGGSDYAVFHASPSTCSPPTARPGTSNHEDGLAIDFSCGDGQPMTHASPCFGWLAAYAHIYGLYNLPSEPWHWSVTGR